MYKNNDWWDAVDNFCETHNLTLSKLAKICGLSSSTLNKSKRYDRYGKPKWLNTNTLTKILNKFHMTIIDFYKYFPKHDD